jgi:hypothetical protein
MIIPARARARGIPTAQPTMTPSLELDPLLDPAPAPAVLDGSVALGVKVTTTLTVRTPPVASEVMLVLVEVKGFAVVGTESGVAVALEPALEAALEAALEDPPPDDAAAEVFDPEPPPPEPPLDASPVILARFGASDAVFLPAVAYAFPS